MDKKNIILIIVAILMILGGLSFIALKSMTKHEAPVEIPTPTVALPTVSESIKVDLSAKSNNKIVDLKIDGVSPDVETIEYELTYTTGTGLPRGVLGKIKTEGKNKVLRSDIDLGTCSRGKCVYDTGVTSINLSLKFNSTSGTSSVFQKTYPL